MKNRKGKIKYFLLALVVLGITYFTVFGDHGILELRKMKQEETKIKAMAEAVKAENEKLKEEIKLLKEDEDYIEKVAREEMGLAQKDEIVYKKQNNQKKE